MTKFYILVITGPNISLSKKKNLRDEKKKVWDDKESASWRREHSEMRNEWSMSHQEQALVSLLSHLALSLDGAVLGFAFAYAAVRTLLKFTATSSALCKLRHAPSLSVSDLRSLLADSPSSDPNSGDGKIVIVRGTVDAKSAVDGTWKTLRPGVLVSRESGDKGVVIQRTQTVFSLLSLSLSRSNLFVMCWE